MRADRPRSVRHGAPFLADLLFFCAAFAAATPGARSRHRRRLRASRGISPPN